MRPSGLPSVRSACQLSQQCELNMSSLEDNAINFILFKCDTWKLETRVQSVRIIYFILIR